VSVPNFSAMTLRKSGAVNFDANLYDRFSRSLLLA
jgi:hypothetical protein